ncbi:MAG: spore germination protein [Tissierellia bacterium]|nr:spore germination protein [Tissierellia bacterium]
MGANISKKLDRNINTLKSILKDCDDVVYRFIEIGDDPTRELCLVFVDGLINKELISEYAIQLMLTETDGEDLSAGKLKMNVLDVLAKTAIAIPEVKEEEDLYKVIDEILVGETGLFIDGQSSALILSSRGWQSRSIDEPESETVIRGPRDGFTETLLFNLASVRRRIRDPRFKAEFISVGRRSKTSLVITYIKDIVNEDILKEVKKRLEGVDIDGVLDSAMLEHLIEDSYMSPFPQMDSTERPDSVAASIYEGRVAILVDNSPFALVIPGTVGTLLQSPEDYYNRWPITTLVRLLRVLALFLSALAPALYIAITSFHPGLIPTRLTFFLGASRINVPFPAVVEAFLMEFTMELLRESGTRIAGPIGNTIGIVGGLIIGQAAVEAGIVSPLMIIIVAITTIAAFVLPSYEFASGLRVWRFIFMGLAAIFGLYGVMLGIVTLSTHLARLESFGIPLTAPYSGLGLQGGDLKDTLIKVPIQRLQLRPIFTLTKNRRRMRRR